MKWCLLLLGMNSAFLLGCMEQPLCPSTLAPCSERINGMAEEALVDVRPGHDDIPETAGEIADSPSAPKSVQTDRQNILTLEALLRRARQASPDLRSALARIRIAEAALDEARAAFYPRLTISENYGITDNPVQIFMFQLNQARLDFNQDFNDPVTTNDFHTRLMARQSLYTGGRRTAEEQAAISRREAARYDFEVVQNQLAFHVAEAYYRLLQARELVQARTEAVTQVENHLTMVKVRFKAGTALRTDVLRVEVRLAEVREALITARNQLQLAWDVVENAVGIPVSRENLPEEVSPVPWSARIDALQQTLTEALHKRPEMERLDSRQQAASAGVQVARAGRYPTLDLIAHYDIFTEDFTSGNDSFFIGLMAQWNLFDGGLTHSRIQQAQARLQEIAAKKQRLMLDIELDIRRAYRQLEDARARLQVGNQAVQQAQESLREISLRFRAQGATATELIDAQVALTEARVRRTNARAEIAIARSNLARAAGRLRNAFQGSER